MPLPVHDGANTAGVSSAGDHAEVAGIELDEVHNLVGVDVHPDGVVHLDQRIRVPDGPSVGGVQIWDALGAHGDLPDAAKLILGLLGADPVDDVTSLDIVNQTEVLVGLLDLKNIHESAREAGVGSDLAVDLHQTVLQDDADFVGGGGVLQPVPEEKGDGHGLSKLMGPG